MGPTPAGLVSLKEETLEKKLHEDTGGVAARQPERPQEEPTPRPQMSTPGIMLEYISVV